MVPITTLRVVPIQRYRHLYSTYNYIGMFYLLKVDAKVQYVPETKQVSKVVVVFPEVGEEANYLLVVFRWTKIVNLSETALKVGG